MKRTLLMAFAISAGGHIAFAQTKTVTVDANDALNNNTKIVAQTSVGQSFFVGHQLGNTYSYPGAGIFRAWTDQPVGSANFYYDGVTNGTTNFSVRADGQGYFAGNMGLGTISPASKLHVYVANNGLNIVGGFQNGNGTETGGNAVGVGFLNEALGNWWKAAIVHERMGAYGVGSLKFLVNNSTDNSSVSLADTKMTILSSGFVGIGTTTPREELSVNGSIRAKQIKVEIANWPDYVFKSSYKLRPLMEVQAFIGENGHLPEIPSSQEIAEKGLNLGEVNRILLQKIEELTLYLIEKDRQLDQQNKKLRSQERRIRKLEHAPRGK
ncbi:hypothetical protein SNE26_07970 [Mucilaginibacter sp. cycad4]|uniref:hypothetical protein n=1 Tax=Mucilaginibacter sp. cycad4 TaxID=3342096 RepID=UPI002AAB83D5|nr:hypothetical protein [Mucilaginibacter gossypii]WPV01706.1 hypothetical protein SNE26_07970 [Mucilaginibacter gossypii]